MIVTRKFVVSGIVQGVWYRRFAADTARKQGLSGWVRNTDDDRVELVACGNLEQISKLESELWTGSPMSEVTSVESEFSEEPTTDNFKILW